MPRPRILALAALVTLVSGGLGAGFAWRWLARELLARRAGQNLPWRSIVQLRGNAWTDLWTGVTLLPVTWGGVLLSVPLWPSAVPQIAGGWWLGWAALVVMPSTLAVTLVASLRRVYRRAPRLLSAEATMAITPAVWRKPFRRHLLGAGVFALPALIAGAVLLFSWPGLFMLRVALVAAVLAPTAGALLALPALLDATHATLIAPPRWVPGPVPRWAAPAGFLTLAFAWGIVGARLVGLVAAGGAWLPASTSTWRDEQLARAEADSRIHPSIVGGAALDAAGLRCESEVVSWAEVDGRAIGWCDEWTSEHGYRTVFFLAEDTSFGEGRLPPVRSRTARGLVHSVVVLADAVVAVETEAGLAFEDGPPALGLVRIEARPDRLARVRRRALPWVRREVPTAVRAQGDRVLVGWLGSRPEQDAFYLYDAHLRPGRSIGERVREQVGTPALIVLGLAALGAALAVLLVARAGRLARVVRRRTAHPRRLGVPGPVALRGVLAPAGALAVLRTEAGESVAVEPSGALQLGWHDSPELAGPCVVIGELRAPRGGAYRAGLPTVRSGRPFALLRGDLAAARRLADEVRERLLRRALPLLWAVSAVPFAVVIACT